LEPFLDFAADVEEKKKQVGDNLKGVLRRQQQEES